MAQSLDADEDPATPALPNNSLDKSISCAAAYFIVQSNGNFKVAIAAHQASTNTVFIAEFDDGSRNTNLERTLNALAPNKIIVPKFAIAEERARIAEVCERNKLVLQEVDKNWFESSSAVRDAERFVRESKQIGFIASNHELSSKVHLMKALGSLLTSEALLTNSTNFNQYFLRPFFPDDYVGMNSGSSFALGLQQRSGPNSLFNFLNRCRTASGRRLLSLWLTQPLRDSKQINKRLDVVEFFVTNNELRRQLGQFLKRFPDFEYLAKRAERKSVTLADIYKICKAVEFIPSVTSVLEKELQRLPNSSSDADDLKSYMINDFIAPLKDLTESADKTSSSSVSTTTTKKTRNLAVFCSAVAVVLDIEHYNTTRDFRVRPDLSEELSSCNEKLQALLDKLRRECQKIADAVGIEPDKIKLENTALPSYDGWHMRVTRQNEKLLRSCKQLIFLGARNAGVQFITQNMRELSEQFRRLQADYHEQEQKQIAELALVTQSYSAHFRRIGELLAPIDVALSLADVACNSSGVYTKPTVLPSDAGIIRLIQSRHPLLVATAATSVIPNDIVITRRGANDMQTFHIITGPNMGGKSTLLKQCGICVLLAHIGAYVPAVEATISVVDRILARAGAGDCMMAGVSTFMAEMLEMSSIVEAATENSLVLIDELGRGTSTFDGFGLATAIARQLITENRSYCLFATHFHEITALSVEYPLLVRNQHMQAIVERGGDNDMDADAEGRLTLLFQVADGACKHSYGIDIARMTGFPKAVTEHAARQLAQLEAAAGKFNHAGSSSDLDSTTTAQVADDALALMSVLKTRLATVFSREKAGDGVSANDDQFDEASVKKIVEDFMHQPEVLQNNYLQSLTKFVAG